MNQLVPLQDEELEADVKYSVRHLWGMSTTFYGTAPPPFRVPCTNPCSIMRAQLPMLKTQEYVVGEKTDGVRMYLLCSFLMRASDGDREEEYGVLLDRAGHMYRVPVRAVGDVFAGTLLDGELCAHGDFLHYVIFDVVACNGYSVTGQKHGVRMETARALAPTLVIPNMTLSVKVWHPLSRAVDVLAAANKEHCDGLILVPATRPLQPGTQYDLFKWKPGYSHTVDLVHNGKFLCAWGDTNVLCVMPDLADCIWEEPLLPEHHGKVCEFQLRPDPDTGRWYVKMVKLRPDKPHPNSLRVVELTMQNIVEDIKVEELVA